MEQMPITKDAISIVNIIHKFNKTKDICEAGDVLLEEVCSLFNFDRASIYLKDDGYNGYIRTFNHESKSKKSKSYLDDLKINLGTHIARHKVVPRETDIEFNKIFDEHKFFYTKDFKSIENIMDSVKFIHNDDIDEFFMFLCSGGWFLFYITFERNFKQVELTSDELLVLKSICGVFQHRLEQFEELKDLKNEVDLHHDIMYNENMPVAVISTKDDEVLFHNKLFFQIDSNIEVGEKCYILHENNQCDGVYYEGSDRLIANRDDANRHWILKSKLVTLSNGVETYIVYAKDTLDYIEQLGGLDLLCNCLSLKGFEDYYKNIIKHNNNSYVLATFDVDKFKHINNTFGYEFGDELLKKLADVLKDFAGNDEFFCRITEDRFAFLMKYDNEEHMKNKFENLSIKFAEMQNKHFKDIKVTVIGGACLVEEDVELNVLIDRANTSRKSAKGSHVNTTHFFNDELKKKIEKEKDIESKMFSAIKNKEFVPYLQAKFDIVTRELYGAEALVRWQLKDGSMIYPDEFIPLFEENGFITVLDFYMYEYVMKYIRDCLDNNIDICPISLNVSRGHIKDKDFMYKFNDLINKYKIPTKLIELELTESAFVEDSKQLNDFINNIKKQNIKVSIDDFGTAYSSLQTLKDIDIDVLKIDKGFLDNINAENITEKHTKDKIVIKHIISMAKELDFSVVCEGIETEEQISVLKNIGCEHGQGYLFAKPTTIDEFQKRFYGKK